MRFRSLVLAALIPTLIVVLMLSGCGRPRPVALPGEPAAFTLPETIRIRTAGRIVDVPLETYVIGTALAEVGPVGEAPETIDRIFRVQAIIARTYAVYQLGRHGAEGFDLCDTTHCQVYDPARLRTSRFAEAATNAVEATAGQVLMFGHRPGQALFHADCGGHTADATHVWGGAPVPYLVGTDDALPEGTHQTWEFELSRDELRRALNESPIGAVGASLDGVRVVDQDESGRASHLEVDGTTSHMLRGEQLRSIINAAFGPRAIRSTRFALSRTDPDSFRFDGTGFGHGVGLCQVGAAARLRRGDSVEAVLAAYYPGMRLTPVAGRPGSATRPAGSQLVGPRPFPGR